MHTWEGRRTLNVCGNSHNQFPETLRHSFVLLNACLPRPHACRLSLLAYVKSQFIHHVFRRLQRGSRLAQWHSLDLHFNLYLLSSAAIAAVISAAAAAAMAYLYATAACLAALSDDTAMTNVLSEPTLGNNLRTHRGNTNFVGVDADKWGLRRCDRSVFLGDAGLGFIWITKFQIFNCQNGLKDILSRETQSTTDGYQRYKYVSDSSIVQCFWMLLSVNWIHGKRIHGSFFAVLS